MELKNRGFVVAHCTIHPAPSRSHHVPTIAVAHWHSTYPAGVAAARREPVVAIAIATHAATASGAVFATAAAAAAADRPGPGRYPGIRMNIARHRVLPR
jgi:hypothetical protein